MADVNASEQGDPGVRFPPPLVFIGFLVIGILVEPASWDGFRLSTFWRYLGSGMLIIIGTGLIAAALGLFRRAGTNPEPWKPATAIVDTGIYGVTRNPMYLGMAAMQLGLAVLADSVAAALLVAVSVACIRFFVIAKEEAYLTAKFGQPYRDYMARVPRWL